MKSIVILYHGNCLDGFSAAWAAWKKFKNRASYIPLHYGINAVTLPKDLKKKEVYSIDFCPGEETVKKIMRENSFLCVIDHHESTQEIVKKLPNHSFDLDHSGAILAWKHFHPQKPIPKLLAFVEDKDLWRFKLAHTKEVNALLELQDFKFEVWSKLVRDLEKLKTRKHLIEKGRVICEYREKVVQTLAGQADEVLFEGVKTLAVNSPILSSEIGHALVTKKPPMGIIWYLHKGKLKVSLRSDGKLDICKFAKKYGGGGHKSAAAFRLSSSEKFPWKVLKKTANGEEMVE